MFRFLRPISFANDVDKHSKLFYPGTRKYIISAFGEWLSDPDSRLFWLKGGPGTGKSVIAAHLCHAFSSSIAAVHFCIHTEQSRKDPKRFVTSLVFQLCQRIPSYHQRVLAVLKERGSSLEEAANYQPVTYPVLRQDVNPLSSPLACFENQSDRGNN